MKLITLTRGKFVQVDDEDFENLNQFKWQAHTNKSGHWYAVRTVNKSRNNPKYYQLKMHRVIMGVTDPKVFVDHKDHNGLNCQRYNMRKADVKQNGSNRKLEKKGSSIYKGVSWNQQASKWIASVTSNGEYNYLGSFNSEIEAAKAYNEKAKELFGEFASLNKF